MNYQAAVTAIALVACATGTPLNWWKDAPTVPTEVRVETGGDGDDIGLSLRNAESAEVQAKKGMKKGAKLWEALEKLADGVHAKRIGHGLLAIGPDSSGTVAHDLADDIRRMALGRLDHLTEMGRDFRDKLQAKDLPVSETCQKLTIQTIDALAADASDIRAAITRLETITASPEEALRAWEVLLADAAELIQLRGARTPQAIARLFEEKGVRLSGEHQSPVGVSAALAAFTRNSNATFKIIGVDRELPLADAWIPVKCEVKAPEAPADLQGAMKRYHDWTNRSSRDALPVDPMTLGRFYPHAVVVAGPGMGKSTILKRLALIYADDDIPVARASLKRVAARMEKGETFVEAFFAIALGGSRTPDAHAKLPGPWVLLADGLDECGGMQSEVAAGLRDYAQAHPGARIVAVTRPIGYQPAPFETWRHYELLSFDATSTTPYLADLLETILGPDAFAPDNAYDWVKEKTKGSDPGALAARSPLLLSLSAALLARDKVLTGRLSDLYREILKLIEEEPSPRQGVSPPSPIRNRVLELLADRLVREPLTPSPVVEEDCATRLAEELEIRPLAAAEKVAQSVEHWEAVGVLERLHHEGDQVFTFVHKTIGEYVAARYLVQLPGPERAAGIDALARIAEGAEPLTFAASLGAAEEVCESLLARSLAGRGDAGLNQALSIATDSRSGVSAALKSRLIQRTVDRVQSERRSAGIEAAIALLAAAPRAPGEVAERVRPLLSDARDWVQLAAWSATLAAGDEDYDYDALKAVFAEVPRFFKDDLNLQIGRGLRLFRRSLGDLLQPFALAAARKILEREPPRVAEDLMQKALDVEHFGGIGFTRQLHVLFEEFGLSLTLRNNKERDWTHRWHHERYAAALTETYRQVLEPIALPDGDLPPDIVVFGTPPIELAAFWSVMGIDDRLAGDVWDWQPRDRQASVAEAARAVALISGVAMDRLARQARILLRQLARPGQRWFDMPQLPEIDYPNPEWERGAGFGVDPLKIEPLLYHPSQEATLLAARIIDGCCDVAARLEIAGRAIKRGTKTTSGMGAAIARSADEAKALDLIYARLKTSGDAGIHSIFNILRQPAPAFDARAVAAIERGLASNEEIAVQAAELALFYAERGKASLLPVLKAAYAHWAESERPPQKGGFVPPTPRGTLLKAIFTLAPPTVEELIVYHGDSRNEVTTTARETLAEKFATDPDSVEPVFDAVAERRLGRTTLNLFLARPALLTPERVARLLDWFKSDDAYVRESIVPLLSEPFMTLPAIADWARRLTQDPDFHVREAGHRVLRNLQSTAPETARNV